MKAVLLSIRPKYCELIANGEKTVEVRKTRPKLEAPFKCYIYCTNDRKIMLERSKYDKSIYLNGNIYYPHKMDCSLNGKVIGEFVCDRIEDYSEWKYDHAALLRHIDLYAATNGDYKFLSEYIPEKKGFGWHISDLVIYDKPKELGEFVKPYDAKHCVLPTKLTCNNCDRCYIKRPPQSWCYVEELT